MNRPGGAGRAAERLVHLASPGGAVLATVDRHGGGLHSLTYRGEPLVRTYDAAGPVPYCAGSVLFPWPNRVRGGVWSEGTSRHRLAITDPELGNANHGLVLDAWFDVAGPGADRVVVSTVVEPQLGFPFRLALDITYRVDDTGLIVEHTIRNLGGRPAPVALGTHPYLRVGRVPTEELRLTVEAERHLVVDAALIPVGDEPVDDEVDLRRGHVLGRRERNTCYHGLTPHGSATEAGCGAVSGRGGIGGPAGHEALSRYRHVLTAPDGRAVHLWSDASFVYVQVYVTDRFPDPEVGTTRAVAVEPMTAAPDALNSGRGLRWLAPDERWDLAWGVRTVGWPGGEGPTGSPPS